MAAFTADEKKKFDRIKDLVIGVIRIMDNDKGLNVKRYEDMFKLFEQNPDMFRKWDMLHNDDLDSAPTLIQLPFEEVRMPQIKKAAEFLGIELENYIYYRHHDKRGIRSKMKVPIGYCTIKRVRAS